MHSPPPVIQSKITLVLQSSAMTQNYYYLQVKIQFSAKCGKAAFTRKGHIERRRNVRHNYGLKRNANNGGYLLSGHLK